MPTFLARACLLSLLSAVALLASALALQTWRSGAPSPHSVLAAEGELRWYRGNIHTHTLWSDGDDYPEMVALWYRERDYDFLCFTDHNTLLDRERWIDPLASKGGQPALDKLRANGCDVLVYACTGEFPPMPGDENVLFPSRVLNGLATGLLPRGRLGLLIPLAEQGEKLASKWARPGLEVVAEALAPSAGQGEAVAAAERLAAKKPDLVAMDCMSYTPTTKDWIKGLLGVPALLAITATGRVLREMLDPAASTWRICLELKSVKGKGRWRKGAAKRSRE